MTSIPPDRKSTPTTSAAACPPRPTGCDLIFCDPPYHTMLARQYARDGIATAPLSDWIAFLHDLARHAFAALQPGGYLALLLAPQTEKDLPAGFGYLDHAFFGYTAATRAGFLPERRISCPMDGAYLPQHVRRARERRTLARPGPRPARHAQAIPIYRDVDHRGRLWLLGEIAPFDLVYTGEIAHLSSCTAAAILASAILCMAVEAIAALTRVEWVKPTKDQPVPGGFHPPYNLRSRPRTVPESRATGQLVDLAAHEGVGEGGVAPDERLGELVGRLAGPDCRAARG